MRKMRFLIIKRLLDFLVFKEWLVREDKNAKGVA